MDKEPMYRAFLGPQNTGYYLKVFAGFDQTGKAGVNWNWSAFLFSAFWFLWRGLWLPGLLTGAFTVASVVGVWVAVSRTVASIVNSNATELVSLLMTLDAAGSADNTGAAPWWGFVQLVGLAFTLVPPLFANAWYYRLCQRRIAQVNRLEGSPDARLVALAKAGGTRWLGVVLLVCALAASLFAASFLAS